MRKKALRQPKFSPNFILIDDDQKIVLFSILAFQVVKLELSRRRNLRWRVKSKSAHDRFSSYYSIDA